MEQGAGVEDSEEEVATPQVVDTQNTIPSKFSHSLRKETAPVNPPRDITEPYISYKHTSEPTDTIKYSHVPRHQSTIYIYIYIPTSFDLWRPLPGLSTCASRSILYDNLTSKALWIIGGKRGRRARR